MFLHSLEQEKEKKTTFLQSLEQEKEKKTTFLQSLGQGFGSALI